ncbi:alpha/beta-hydrolase [Scenedesmus sp. NREL 46B-D3]|nr:alpha/beta-hydrolase [Scenedesmus sp. NREL 46B-D3]
MLSHGFSRVANALSRRGVAVAIHQTHQQRYSAAAAAAGTQQQPRTSLQPPDIRTEVVDRVSSPDMIKSTAQKLQQIGPSGRQKLLMYQLAALPVWVASAVRLAAKYATCPGALLGSPDAAAFQLVPPFPLEEEHVTVNGIKLHTVSPGRRRDKPLMLFVHGFPELWYSWRHQMAALHATGQWDVVAIDMRGYNTSDKPQGVEQYRLPVLASDVQQAVHALGHASCTLVAHDWGGLVAWVVAGMYGRQLVDKLIVMGLPHVGVGMVNSTMTQRKRQLYILLFQARWLAEKVISADNAAALDGMFRSEPAGLKNLQGTMPDEALAWYRAAMCQPGAATGTLNWYRAFMEFVTLSDPQDPAWSAMRRVLDMPALVLHGDCDVALGEELLDGIEAAVPDVTVKVLKNCSHWVQQDYPSQVNEIMLDWLSKQQQQQQQQQ